MKHAKTIAAVALTFAVVAATAVVLSHPCQREPLPPEPAEAPAR